MEEAIKLIVTGSKPDDIVKCVLIASKVRKYVQRYTKVQILFSANVRNISGIAVEDELFVKCDDEEESIERLIDGISRVVSKRKFMDIAVAAAVFSKD